MQNDLHESLLVMIQQTSQTVIDGQTDDVRSQDRALHYSASRTKNTSYNGSSSH